MGESTVAVSVAVDLLISLLANAQKISLLIQTADAQGVTVLSKDQWASVVTSDDQAEADLAKLIGKLQAAASS